MSPVYGTFAVVLGLMAWLYLQAELTLYAIEVDVVRARHLWPRTMFGQIAGPRPTNRPTSHSARWRSDARRRKRRCRLRPETLEA